MLVPGLLPFSRATILPAETPWSEVILRPPGVGCPSLLAVECVEGHERGVGADEYEPIEMKWSSVGTSLRPGAPSASAGREVERGDS